MKDPGEAINQPHDWSELYEMNTVGVRFLTFGRQCSKVPQKLVRPGVGIRSSRILVNPLQYDPRLRIGRPGQAAKRGRHLDWANGLSDVTELMLSLIGTRSRFRREKFWGVRVTCPDPGDGTALG